MWGTAGYGVGRADADADGAGGDASSLNQWLAAAGCPRDAAGGRREGGANGLTLAAKSDAMMATGVSSGKAQA